MNTKITDANYLAAGLKTVSVFLAVLVLSGCASPAPYNIQALSLIGTDATEFKVARLAGPADTETLVALALENNPELIMLREDVKTARAERRVAAQVDNPEIRFAYDNSSSDTTRFRHMPLTNAPWWIAADTNGIPTPAPPPGSSASNVRRSGSDDTSFEVALRIRPPNPWILKRRISAADARVAAAEADLRAKEWSIRADILRAVEEYRCHIHDSELLTRLLEVHSNMVELVKIRVKSGAARFDDEVNATRRFIQVSFNHANTLRDTDWARRDLVAILGISLVDVEITTNFPPMQRLRSGISVGELENIARNNRADIAALGLKIKAAEEDLKEARSASIPWFTSIGGSYRNSTGGSFINPDEAWTASDGTDGIIPNPIRTRSSIAGSEWSVEASISVPIFTWAGDYSAVQRAEYERRKKDLSLAWQMILSDLREASSRVEVTMKNLERFQQEFIPATKQLQATYDELESGGRLSPDIKATTAASFLEYQLTMSQLEHQYRTALRRLSSAIGKELTPDLLAGDSSRHAPGAIVPVAKTTPVRIVDPEPLAPITSKDAPVVEYISDVHENAPSQQGAAEPRTEAVPPRKMRPPVLIPSQSRVPAPPVEMEVHYKPNEKETGYSLEEANESDEDGRNYGKWKHLLGGQRQSDSQPAASVPADAKQDEIGINELKREEMPAEAAPMETFTEQPTADAAPEPVMTPETELTAEPAAVDSVPTQPSEFNDTGAVIEPETIDLLQ